MLTSLQYKGYAKLTKRVERGIDWLDKNVPDWDTKIEVDSFDLSDPSMCVMGQVFMDRINGTYSDGYNYAFKEIPELDKQEKMVKHGFEIDRSEFNESRSLLSILEARFDRSSFSGEFRDSSCFELLAELWIERIQARKAQRKVIENLAKNQGIRFDSSQ
jgi:hypothetical protein